MRMRNLESTEHCFRFGQTVRFLLQKFVHSVVHVPLIYSQVCHWHRCHILLHWRRIELGMITRRSHVLQCHCKIQTAYHISWCWVEQMITDHAWRMMLSSSIENEVEGIPCTESYLMKGETLLEFLSKIYLFSNYIMFDCSLLYIHSRYFSSDIILLFMSKIYLSREQ